MDNIIFYKMVQEFFDYIIKKNNINLDKSYYHPQKVNTLEEVFEWIVVIAQNYQSLPNVIKYHQRRDAIKKILNNFDVQKCKEINPEELYYTFRKEFNVISKDTKMNIWRKWSYSIVDSAKFLSEFASYKEFDKFVNNFAYNKYTKYSLPLFLSDRIKGFGFALACNFLKDVGYEDYPKPDVHLKDVLVKTNMCKNSDSDVFEKIIEIAQDNDITPYCLDKMIWSICSGRFNISDKQTKGYKQDLIDYLNIEQMEKKEITSAKQWNNSKFIYVESKDGSYSFINDIKYTEQEFEKVISDEFYIYFEIVNINTK